MLSISEWCTHHTHTQRGQNADQRHEIMRSTFTCKNILQSTLLLIEMGPTLLYGLAYKFHHLSEDDRAISHDCKMQYAICICILRCMHRKKLLWYLIKNWWIGYLHIRKSVLEITSKCCSFYQASKRLAQMQFRTHKRV